MPPTVDEMLDNLTRPRVMPPMAVLCYCLMHLVGHDQSVAALECGSTGFSPLTRRVAETIRDAGVPPDVPGIGAIVDQVLGS